MYSRGTTPPLMASMNSMPLPASLGSILSTTWPYWPLPPDWRTNLPSASCTVFRDGFPVGHLGLAHVGLDAEFTPHAIDDDFQVQLAHAADDGLARLLVGADTK